MDKAGLKTVTEFDTILKHLPNLEKLKVEFTQAAEQLDNDGDDNSQQSTIQAESGSSPYSSIKDLTLLKCSLQKDKEIVYIMGAFNSLHNLSVGGGMHQTMDISRDILKSFF